MCSTFQISHMNSSKPSDDQKTGEITRLVKALGYSADGFKAVASHPAVRLELILAAILIPLALLIGRSPVEKAILIGSVFLVLIVELLNTCVEKTIDRISTDFHPLSKIAKDVGSAAVLLSLVNAAMMWFLLVIL